MLGALASPLDMPLRPAASPSASPPRCRALGGCLPCPHQPNHQHVPRRARSSETRLGSGSIHSSSAQSVPFFFSAKAAFPLPLSAPSAAKPAAKARFLLFFFPFFYYFSWSPLFIGYVSSWLWLLFKRAGKQRQENSVIISLNSSKMLATQPKSSQLAPQSSWDSTFQYQHLCKLRQDHSNQEMSQIWQRGGMGYNLGGILTSGAHNTNNNKIITDVQSI